MVFLELLPHDFFLKRTPVEGEAVRFQCADQRREALPRGRGFVEKRAAAFLVWIVVFEHIQGRGDRDDAVPKAEPEFLRFSGGGTEQCHVRRGVHAGDGVGRILDDGDAVRFLLSEAREDFSKLRRSFAEDEKFNGEFEEPGEYGFEEGASPPFGHLRGEAEHGALFLGRPPEFLLERELLLYFSFEQRRALGVCLHGYLPIIEQEGGCSLGAWIGVISCLLMAIT